MSTTVVHVTPDLGVLRLEGPGGSGIWRAPAMSDGDGPPGAAEWRQRAQDAAAWLGQQRAARRRLGAVIVDPSESLCLWVRSSSLAPPVLGAAVRRLTEEWGDSAGMWSVEPVHELPRDAEVSGGGHALSVICHHDAVVRLFLDALDRRAVVPQAVMSGWHALAQHATKDAGLSCVIAHELADEHAQSPGRLLWAWSENGTLLAGGSAAVGDLDGEMGAAHATSALQRLAMDWMSWSSQLGTAPERVLLLGPGAKALESAHAASFPDRPVRVVTESEALSSTLGVVADRADDAGGWKSASHTSLTRVSHRPTRATRKQYQFVAIAALLVGVAIGSIAFRMGKTTSEWRVRANDVRAQTMDTINTTWDGGIEGRPTSLSRVARQLYEAELAREGIKLPRPPYKIYYEMNRVMTLLVDVLEQERPEEVPQGEVWQMRVTRLAASETGLSLGMMVPAREVGTTIRERLNGDGAAARWEQRRIANNPEQPNYQGSWQ